MKVVVIGAGYVGLVSAACFAEFGLHVTCVDHNVQKIVHLNAGEIPIYEPGLEDLIARNRRRLHFSVLVADAIRAADVVMIAVGTPTDTTREGHADLSYVFEAAEEIAKNLTGYKVIVTKSTVPEGTGRAISDLIKKRCPQADFDIVSNPEFLREGSAIEDFMQPDRIVIGAASPRAFEVMRQLYRPLENEGRTILCVSTETAELIKYASNAFLATKVAFINQLTELCERCGADIQEVARGMGYDQRIGSKFLQAGPGFGGSCFPKDILALRQRGHEMGIALPIIDAVIHSNAAHRTRMVQKIMDAFDGNVKGKTLAFLGVTFKANTDDMRDSPSLEIIPALQAQGAIIKAYDPAGMKNTHELSNIMTSCEGVEEAVLGADAAIILTEWNEFRALDFEVLSATMKSPILIDLRNLYEISDLEGSPVRYISLGRKTVGGFVVEARQPLKARA